MILPIQKEFLGFFFEHLMGLPLQVVTMQLRLLFFASIVAASGLPNLLVSLALETGQEPQLRKRAECGPGIGSCDSGFCCSESGYCGKTVEYCEGSQCQLDYSDSCDTLYVATTGALFIY